VSPTTRAAYALGVVALLALALPVEVALVLGGAIVAATVADAVLARRTPRLTRSVPPVLVRGIAAQLVVTAGGAESGRSRVRVRQPAVPDIAIEPPIADGRLDARVTARRRGRHRLPPVAARRIGPLGLGSWQFAGGTDTQIVVYPDVPAARRIVTALRRGRFRDPGLLARGPRGLGTEFETVRDYQPDDDIRQVNWAATARVGRPMSNQYRVEQDRDVICLVDSGRLMSAPIVDRTRLDAALDALAAVVLVADELGDRCGVVAFDAEIRRRVATGRRNSDAVIGAVFDLEPRAIDSDYELAFRSVGSAKRALVVVFTDLLDEAAARSLVAAVPMLARRHAVVVASVRDPDVDGAVTSPPRDRADVYRAAVALDLLDGRRRVAAELRSAGAEVVEASPERLAAACVRAYLRLKSRARI
jgi:uncharacterized protein (DUF58 family)